MRYLRFLDSLNTKVSQEVWMEAYEPNKALSDALKKARGE